MDAVQKFLRLILVSAVAPLLAACGSADDATINIAIIGEKDNPFETGVHLSTAAQLTRSATMEGLVSFDEQGRVVPALADRWIVTDDGKSYIFRLRDGTWLDGSPITSKQARIALLDAIRALRGTPLARDLAGIREVRAMTGRVVEIRLARSMPHFLQLIAQPELGLRSRNRAAGPMALERSGDLAILTPIKPSRLGLPRIENWSGMTKQIRLEAVPGEEAVARLNRGDADVVIGGTIANFPLSSRVGILRGTIQPDPVIGLFGLQVMSAKGFLAEPENREAIAMAIDRQALIAPFSLAGWVATTRIVPPGLEGDTGLIGERWEQVTLEQRRAEARSRVQRWRERKDEEGPLVLSVWLPAGPGSDMLFASLARDLAAVGIELKRTAKDRDADLQLVDDVAHYPRAAWFLNRLSCSSKRGLCDKGADALAAEAMTTDDAVERAQLLVEAEVDLTVANVYIPLGAPVRWSLVRGNVNGFASNRLGWHPLMPMAMKPK
jgi:peptide/nickel transport system substrate-binding protein/oligopeptide transport system substrate-binding protein